MSEEPEETQEAVDEVVAPLETAGAPEHPVDPRYVSLQRVTGWLVTAVISVITLVGLLIFGLVMRPSLPVTLAFFGLWLLICGIFAVMGHVWPALEHRHLSYCLSQQGIQIRCGVFWRQAVTVPRNRIQHTDVSQGPLERRFGLATVLVHTAGTEFARVSLPGVENQQALAIRDHLMAGGEDAAV